MYDGLLNNNIIVHILYTVVNNFRLPEDLK